jgi:glutamate N-acetyltransferase/amino-acid N-acetyltransferase
MKRIVCSGFKVAGIASGLKTNGGKDLGFIYTEVPTNVAGLFTRNRIQAAPVLLDRERIKSGTCQAIIINSGNANCCNGAQGMHDAVAMAKFAAEALGIVEDAVLVASTGVIGVPLPIEKIKAAVPDLVQAAKPEGISDLAEAIMTTDTVPKIVSAQDQIDGQTFYVNAVAKGAGMIRPDMATMLCFVMSDIQAPSDIMKGMLSSAVEKSFNRITIDGDTSTNDTILFMANGKSGIQVNNSAQRKIFQKVLDDVLMGLARLLIKDGEGATKLVEIKVKGAQTLEAARKVADTVAHSNLVKTALFGEDANWGRILAAAGRAGVLIDPDHIDVLFDDIYMVKNGVGCGNKAEARCTEILKKPEFILTIDLNMGSEHDSMMTCDFSLDYVKINANYRT